MQVVEMGSFLLTSLIIIEVFYYKMWNVFISNLIMLEVMQRLSSGSMLLVCMESRTPMIMIMSGFSILVL